MEPKYKIGDIVKLKSDSPAMTVTSVIPLPNHVSKSNVSYACHWWNWHSYTFDSAQLPEDALEPTKLEPKSKDVGGVEP